MGTKKDRVDMFDWKYLSRNSHQSLLVSGELIPGYMPHHTHRHHVISNLYIGQCKWCVKPVTQVRLWQHTPLIPAWKTKHSKKGHIFFKELINNIRSRVHVQYNCRLFYQIFLVCAWLIGRLGSQVQRLPIQIHRQFDLTVWSSRASSGLQIKYRSPNGEGAERGWDLGHVTVERSGRWR